MKKNIFYFLIFIIFLGPYSVWAQQNKIDSLLKFLKISKEDTSQINALNKLSGQYTNIGSYEQARQAAQRAYLSSVKLNYKKGIAKALHCEGNVYYYQGKYEDALNSYFKSVKIREDIGDAKGIADLYTNIGAIYCNLGSYDKALSIQLKSLSIKENIGDKKGMADSYLNLGNIYYNQGNYEKALDNYLKNLAIKEEIGDKSGAARSYNNIGNIYYYQGNNQKALESYRKYMKLSDENGDKEGIAASFDNIGLVFNQQGNYDKSLENLLKGLAIREQIGDKRGLAISFSSIGNTYQKKGNAEVAEEYYLKSLKIQEEIGDKQGLATSLFQIGSIFLEHNKFEESNYYINKALVIDKELGYKNGIETIYLLLSELYDKEGDYKQAYIYHKLYSDIKDTLLNEQSSKQIAEMNTKYDSEKKDKELIKKDAEISKQLAETEKKNLQRNAFIIGFALVLVLAFFIFRGYRQKQNANKLLEKKNILIENQKQLVEEKNLKITDSINYAKRIQQAILPSQELIKSCFPESFIFFRPKDIVSGDFYWFAEKNDKLIIAAADCTGHGVPGAFMSMIGNTLLNEIVNVKNILEPSKILNELNKGIVNLLNQSSTDSTTQDDGMDITIIAIDKTMQEMEFAGANHFSYLFNNSQFKTLKGDVFSIGGMFGRADINFTSQKIKIEKGSTIYLFTDGFVDQFGGEKNTKFLSGRFETLLQNIQPMDMEHQKENLSTAFDDWKAQNKQLDDLLVMGIKI